MQFVRIQARRVVATLAVIVCVLVALHLASFIPELLGYGTKPIMLLNLDGEQNFASLYSSLLLWFCAALTWFVSKAVQERKESRKWMGLSIVFSYLATDEAVSLHERLSILLRDGGNPLGLDRFAWLLPYSVILLILALAYISFFWKLPAGIRLRIALGGALFIGGGMGCEFLGWAWLNFNGGSVGYQLEIMAEEILEMIGSIVLISALLGYLSNHCSCAGVVVSSPDAVVSAERN